MSETATHLRELAGRIGPRPATTDTEAEAAEYIKARFEARGLEVKSQEFLAPRTYSWAFIVYHVMTMGAAVLVNWYPSPAFALALISAVLMWLDLDTRWGLSSLMPRGPSQNVIGHKRANVRRGETARSVVIIAHYDSARASLAFHPSLVKDFGITFGLMKWCTWLVVPLTLLTLLEVGFLKGTEPWFWYATMLAAVYLLVPTLINTHRELFMPFVDGANDNASGVAAMLGILERAVPEEVTGADTQTMPAVTVFEPAMELDVEQSFAEPEEAGAVEDPPEGGTLAFSPAGVSDEVGPSVSSGVEVEDADELDWDEPRVHEGQETLAMDEAEHAEDWLGVEEGFNAVGEGRRIGSWENFSSDDEEGSGSKGGIAGLGAVDDPGFAASEAARIRHLVTHGVDRDLSEKDIWFVATGAEETGTWGMKAFLKEFGDDLAGAAFINLDNVGSGSLAWVTREGMARKYRSDRRLLSAAKRVARENDLHIKGREYRGLSTDATPALARGYRAMSVMAFDINGRLPNWHWKTDTVENVSIENVEQAADFVVRVIKEL